MNRRRFITLLGSAAIAPALPAFSAAPLQWSEVHTGTGPIIDYSGLLEEARLRRAADEKRWLLALEQYRGAYDDACRVGTGFIRITQKKVTRISIYDVFQGPTEGQELS